jgi:hypothetical protein
VLLVVVAVVDLRLVVVAVVDCCALVVAGALEAWAFASAAACSFSAFFFAWWWPTAHPIAPPRMA